MARRRVGLGISRLPHRRSTICRGVSADERQVRPPPGLSRPSKSLDFVDECPEISIGALDARCSWYLMPWSHSVLFVIRSNFKTTAPLLLKNPSDLGVNSSATIEPAGRDLGRTAGPMGASAEGVEKGPISLTQPRPMDCRGSGRATFVAIVNATDLRKCDDLASRRRWDAAGVRTIFV